MRNTSSETVGEQTGPLERSNSLATMAACYSWEDVDSIPDGLEKQDGEVHFWGFHLEQKLLRFVCSSRKTLNSRVNFYGPGYLYIVQMGDILYFKYGITVDPKNRLKNLQTGNPLRLVMKCRPVAKILPAENDFKERIEKNYARGSVNGGQEWFKIRKDDEQNVMDCFNRVCRKHNE